MAVATGATVGCRRPAPQEPLHCALEAGAEALLDRSRDVLWQVRSEPPQRWLERIPSSDGPNGDFVRLDERLDDATVELRGDRSSVPPSPDLEVRLRPVQGELHVDDDTVEYVHQPGGYLIGIDVPPLRREDLDEIEIELRLARGTEMELLWSKHRLESWRPDAGWQVAGRVKVRTVPDGRWRRYRIAAAKVMQLHLDPEDTLRTLLLRPSNVAGDEIGIRPLRIRSRRDRYLVAGVGRESRFLNREMRTVIHVAGPASLGFRVTIPQERPRLHVGIGVLPGDPPVTFRATIAYGGERRTVLEHVLRTSDRWRDAEIGLEPWAGREVVLELETSGPLQAVGFWSSPTVRGAPRRRVHVLMVLQDCLRADHLSALGHPLGLTPVTDRLAARGVLFERAVSQGTKTRVSVPSLMTSLYPTATGVLNHEQVLDERYLTLAEAFRSSGFETASFIQNGNAGPWGGLDQGFDVLRDASSLSGKAERLFGRHLFTWLENHRDRNTFTYVHVLDPHGPYDPPAPHDELFRRLQGGGTPVEWSPLHDPDWLRSPTVEGRRALYAGEVRRNDALLGSLMRELDRLRMTPDTIVVLLADHGEMLGERGMWEHRPPAWPEVVHVPLVVVAPGRLQGGARVSGPVQLVDVMPTVLELAGIDPGPLALQGSSLLPTIRAGRSAVAPDRVAIVEEGMSYGSDAVGEYWGAVLFRDWQVIRSPVLERRVVLRLGPAAGDSAPVPSTGASERLAAAAERLLAELREIDTGIRLAVTHGDAAPVEWDPSFRDELRRRGYVD